MCFFIFLSRFCLYIWNNWWRVKILHRRTCFICYLSLFFLASELCCFVFYFVMDGGYESWIRRCGQELQSLTSNRTHAGPCWPFHAWRAVSSQCCLLLSLQAQDNGYRACICIRRPQGKRTRTRRNVPVTWQSGTRTPRIEMSTGAHKARTSAYAWTGAAQ